MESGYNGIRPQRSVRQGRWKLIWVEAPRDRRSMTGHEFELYDLRADPGEVRNLAFEHPRRVGELAHALRAFVEGARPKAVPTEIETGAIDETSKRLLRELGYLESEPP